MDLHFPPQNWTDFGAFWAFMALVMLVLYFFFSMGSYDQI